MKKSLSLSLSLWKLFLSSIVLSALLSPLYADTVVQKIIFAADKNRTEVSNKFSQVERLFHNNSNAKELKEKYNLQYREIILGDYYAISIHPIKSAVAKESLILLLRPYFADVFTVNSGYIEKSKRVVTISQSSPNSAATEEIVDSYSYLTTLYYWLDQWHVIIVLLLLGGLFYYRRKHQLSHIDTMYHELAQQQDVIEEKLKGD